MVKPTFYRIHRSGTIFYIAVIIFIGLCALGVLRFFLAFADIHNLYPEDYIMLALPIAGYIIWLFYFWSKVGKRRKILINKFNSLSNAEQTEINEELEIKEYTTLWLQFGENRVYFPGSYFTDFVNYRDIVWVYRYSLALPGMVTDGNHTEMISPFNLSYLIIYDNKGIRRKLPVTPADIPACISMIEEKAPKAIIGYSKARKKLAKKDFNRFIIEDKNID